jgi:tripartite-type tricarboxylate transporter receptor subunit TctC
MQRRFLAATMLAGLGWALGTGWASAQDAYPSRPIKFVVPFSAGSATDTLARVLGEKMTASLGQAIVVDNMPGASGFLGAQNVARAEPDGHTVLIATNTTHAANQSLFKKLPYDPIRDFEPVSRLGTITLALIVNPSVPAATTQELIAYGKANPGKLNVGTSGVGSIQHLTAIVIAKKRGIDWAHVPYRGGAAAIRAVVSNESNVIFNGALATMPFVVQGQLKGIAVSGEKRLPQLANLPTFKEIDMPIVETGSWQGFLASKGTPAPIVARLNTELRKVLALPEISAKIIELGGEIRTNAPDEFAGWMTKAIAEWGEVVKAENISLD